MPAWKDYQEEAASFFRSIGLQAAVDVTLEGVRTSHDIDVVVDIDLSGFPVRWIVECKLWKSPISKLNVLALREIVADLGVDRGILLCEVGFQSGAKEAADFTNVQVTSLAALSVSSAEALYAARLRDLWDRTLAASERYWNIPKSIRIETGLRFERFNDPSYSGARVVEAAKEVLAQAMRGRFPIELDAYQTLLTGGFPERFPGNKEVVEGLDAKLVELEEKLNAAERQGW